MPSENVVAGRYSGWLLRDSREMRRSCTHLVANEVIALQSLPLCSLFTPHDCCVSAFHAAPR